MITILPPKLCASQSSVDVPPPFRFIPRAVIEATGNQVLAQVLRVAVPRFLEQVSVKGG